MHDSILKKRRMIAVGDFFKVGELCTLLQSLHAPTYTEKRIKYFETVFFWKSTSYTFGIKVRLVMCLTPILMWIYAASSNQK